MFNKRLIQELKDVMNIIYKQVFLKWIALLTNIILTIILCYLFMSLIDNELSIKTIMYMFIMAFISLIIRGFVLKKANDYSYLSSSKVKRELRTRLFDKVIQLGMRYQEYMTTSELVQLSVEGINQLETYFALYLPQLFYSLLAPLTLFIIFLFFDYKVALILLVCVPLIPISIVAVQKFAKKLLAKYWTSYTTLGDSFLENLQALTTLKIYQSDEYKNIEMNKEAENFRKITMRVLIMQLNSISIMDIVAYGGAGLGSYFAFIHYMNNEISLFAALLIILLSFEFFIPLRQLGSYFHIAMNGVAASDKIFKILDISIDKQTHKELHHSMSSIELNHLSFSYNEDRQVLNDISLKILSHQFIGIVGESGSGKSTIAKLLMGYHSQYNGELLINGMQRNEINDESFLKHFIYISHEPMIFKGSLRDNLCLYHEYSDNQLNDVLKKVLLLDFFNQKEGLDTFILENGSNLSGGQKQRLNLARALLYNSDVYIFDEATSNIDVESENMILSLIKELSQDKTVIMITHRLSNVHHCDNILVMENGHLVESGNHNDLMNHQKTYYKLYKKQEELEVYNHE
jgi:ATP-binding cassette subfamily C protein